MLKVGKWLRAYCFVFLIIWNCVSVYMFRKKVKGNPGGGMFYSRNLSGGIQE